MSIVAELGDAVSTRTPDWVVQYLLVKWDIFLLAQWSTRNHAGPELTGDGKGSSLACRSVPSRQQQSTDPHELVALKLQISH
eukprot:1147316-Pelagomonas_calceolata.AAC.7